jgi:hypothetical protein
MVQKKSDAPRVRVPCNAHSIHVSGPHTKAYPFTCFLPKSHKSLLPASCSRALELAAGRPYSPRPGAGASSGIGRRFLRPQAGDSPGGSTMRRRSGRGVERNERHERGEVPPAARLPCGRRRGASPLVGRSSSTGARCALCSRAGGAGNLFPRPLMLHMRSRHVL